ncbi:carbohydrate ABC transporter permease [Paenibacillus koleovorans]|uniref:carbohydrate ABC transporter permease n=1 Tax=Paenibacillus koleovorans TaxID=121608 RepID=UPI000FD6FE21|nr:carbohydrate ABC transporter permease [Paenibacillus koleovorans]
MKSNIGDRLFGACIYAFLLLIVILVLYPLLFILSASVSDANAILRGEVWLLPKGLHLGGYTKVLTNNDVLIGYGNTILYTVLGTAINVVLTICAAYPLSRKQLLGRNAVTLFLVFTMFFSGGLIPTYLLVKSLGMLNTIWAMIIPTAISVWNIIIMRTFFQSSIPTEVQESAEIDGCSELRILWRIVLPLSMPIIAVMILFYSVGHWNSYFSALIYLSDREKFPLQLFLREMLVQDLMTESISYLNKDLVSQMMKAETAKYAAVIIANLPILMLYPFLQKYFTKGMLVGAIKG